LLRIAVSDARQTRMPARRRRPGVAKG
jgi:hypothetical protein